MQSSQNLVWLGIEGGSSVLRVLRQSMIIQKFRTIYPNQAFKSRLKGRRIHCVPGLQALSTLPV